MKKYVLYLWLIVVLGACQEDVVNDAVPDFPPAIGISNNELLFAETGEDAEGNATSSLIVLEGDTARFYVGIFSDRSNEQEVTVDWSASGGLTQTGSVTIPQGEKSAVVTIPVPENTVADEPRPVTFTITGASDNIPLLEEEGRLSRTFEIRDDVKAVGIEESDTTAVSESAEIISVPLVVRVPSVSLPQNTLDEIGSAVLGLDEDIQVSYTVEGTAVEGVDYELVSPSPVTIAASDASPTIDIRVLNNNALQPDRTLEVSLTGVAPVTPNEEVRLLASSDTAVFVISDDTKSIGFDRLDVATPIAEDTLVVDAAGIYEVPLTITGDLIGEASLEVTADNLPDGVELLVTNPITFAPGESGRIVSFAVSEEALAALAADAFFTLTLENVATANNDEEVSLNPEAIQVLVQLQAP